MSRSFRGQELHKGTLVKKNKTNEHELQRRRALQRMIVSKKNKTNEHELQRRRALQRMIVCICRINIWEHQKKGTKNVTQTP